MPEIEDRGFSGENLRAPWNTEFHVNRWQAGSEEAFSALETHFTPLLVHRVEYRSRSWPVLARRLEPMDVVQDAWCSFVKHGRDRFVSRGKGSFLALMRDILDKKLVDLIRQHTSQKNGEGRPGEALVEDGMPAAMLRPEQAPVETPTSASRASEIDGLAKRVLTDLEYRVWELCSVKNYTSDEAALVVSESGEDIDRSASAIRGILKRVRAKLASHLPDEGTS